MPSPSSASQPKRKRGRPRSFDETQVLDRSIDVFWQRGYRDVTTRDLERQIGISQSSIYNAFGSKEGLYSEVIGRYRHRLETELLPFLEGPAPGRDSLLAYTKAFADWVGNPERPGCLTLTIDDEQRAAYDHLTAYRARLNAALRAAVAGFTEGDELIAQRTTLLQALFLGIGTAARTDVGDDELRRMVDATIAQIHRWADHSPLT